MAKPQMQDPTPIEIEDPLSGEVVPAVAAPSPATRAGATLRQVSMLDKMRDKYKVEKRVRVKIHNDAPVQVQVNGYSFLIRENVPVEVPESIAEILEDAGYI